MNFLPGLSFGAWESSILCHWSICRSCHKVGWHLTWTDSLGTLSPSLGLSHPGFAHARCTLHAPHKCTLCTRVGNGFSWNLSERFCSWFFCTRPHLQVLIIVILMKATSHSCQIEACLPSRSDVMWSSQGHKVRKVVLIYWSTELNIEDSGWLCQKKYISLTFFIKKDIPPPSLLNPISHRRGGV